MKRLLTLIFTLAIAANGGQFAQAVNLLSNPDIDVVGVGDQVLATPINGWHVTSTRSATGAFTDGASSEGFANVFQPAGGCSGSGCGLFFKAFQGTLLNPNATPPTVLNLISTTLYQDVPGMPGAKYSLTGWAGSGGGYIGLTDPSVKSQFAVQFLDGANAVLGSATIDLNTLGLGSPNGNPFGYNQYTVSGVSPAGTVTVRSIAQQLNAYGNPAGGDQAYVVDSFDLEKTAVPEPASMMLGLMGLVSLVALGRRHS